MTMTLDETIEHCNTIAEQLGFDESDGCVVDYRQLAKWLEELKKDKEVLNGLSTYFQSLVVDAAINHRPLMLDMRDASEEERKSVKQYIADSTSTTGVNFWDLIGEVNADESDG